MKRIRLASSVGLVLLLAGILFLARAAGQHPFTWWGAIVSIPGAVLAVVIIGSLYEWILHRYLYHGKSRVKLLQAIQQVHHQGHHWHRFPPDHYVENLPVERIPVFPPQPYAVCGAPTPRRVAWWGQYVLYSTIAIAFVFVPAWLLTGNKLFTVSMVLSGLVVCYLFIRIHDAIHYPAERWIERQEWFRFLDRHHYIHHIDTTTNLNFLLPLCDALIGTLKITPTNEERVRWPSFERAKGIERETIRSNTIPRAGP